MAGERGGQGRKGRWVEPTDELVLEEEASWRVAQGKLLELLGWGRTEGWWPRLVSGRQRSQEHTGSPSKPCQEQGDWGKVREEKRKKTAKFPIPNFNGLSEKKQRVQFFFLGTLPMWRLSHWSLFFFFSNHFFFPFLCLLLSFLPSTLPLLSSDWLEHLHVEELLDIIAPNHRFVNTGNCNCF